MKRFPVFAILTLVVATGLAACGGKDSAKSDADAKTIEIVMKDIAFSPSAVNVQSGETVRFVFQNEGKIAHDAFIGNEDEQAKHEAEMNPEKSDTKSGMGAEHGGGSTTSTKGAITVKPGKSGELKHTFADRGTVLIGCHQPGHYAAGMVIKVTVT